MSYSNFRFELLQLIYSEFIQSHADGGKLLDSSQSCPGQRPGCQAARLPCTGVTGPSDHTGGQAKEVSF